MEKGPSADSTLQEERKEDEKTSYCGDASQKDEGKMEL